MHIAAQRPARAVRGVGSTPQLKLTVEVLRLSIQLVRRLAAGGGRSAFCACGQGRQGRRRRSPGRSAEQHTSRTAAAEGSERGASGLPHARVTPHACGWSPQRLQRDGPEEGGGGEVREREGGRGQLHPARAAPCPRGSQIEHPPRSLRPRPCALLPIAASCEAPPRSSPGRCRGSFCRRLRNESLLRRVEDARGGRRRWQMNVGRPRRAAPK